MRSLKFEDEAVVVETGRPDAFYARLTNLAASFNQMAGSLDGARRKITQQTNEIMAWNQTLEKRVEEKTNELRQAQDMLLRSRSLSALGELGAGVAHEINNPLASVIANLDMALQDIVALAETAKLPPDLSEELKDARTAADRVREIRNGQGLFLGFYGRTSFNALGRTALR